MFKNYNGRNFSEIEQYNALTLLLSNSKKTRNYPIFSIENVLNDEGLLLFLLNQKKFIEISRERNPFGNTMYKLTRRGRNFIEGSFLSKSDYLFLIIINFVIFILPIITYIGIKIFQKKYDLILEKNIATNFNMALIFIWLIIIIYFIIKNRKKRSKKFILFKKKFNLH